MFTNNVMSVQRTLSGGIINPDIAFFMANGYQTKIVILSNAFAGFTYQNAPILAWIVLLLQNGSPLIHLVEAYPALINPRLSLVPALHNTGGQALNFSL